MGKKSIILCKLHLASRQTTLLRAVGKGDAKTTAYLLGKGADVDDAVVQEAAREGNVGILRILAAKKDAQNRTILHRASETGNTFVVEGLLTHECGLDKDATDKDGYTPLHLAVRYGREEVVRVLLGHQAMMDEAMIHEAARQENPGIFRILATRKDTQGRTILHRASETGNNLLVETLVAHKCGLDTNATDKDGSSPLCLALRGEHEEVVKALLEHGAMVDEAMIREGLKQRPNTPLARLLATVSVSKNQTALHLASRGADLDFLKLVLRHEGVTDRRDDDGRTALDLAVIQQDIGMATLLLEHGARADCRDGDDRQTALDLALANKDIRMAELLLRHGASHSGEKPGYTLLMWAARQGGLPQARALLAQGADPRAADCMGRTPLHYAAENNHIHMLGPLVDHGADVDRLDTDGVTALYLAAERGHVEVVQELLARGADENIPDGKGFSILHRAVKRSDTSLVQLLLDQSTTVDVDKLDPDGNTAMHIATENGHSELLRTLAAKGNPKLTNLQGQTLLHIAAQHGQNDIVSFLLEKSGLSVDIQDSNGDTPLYLAAENGHRKIMRMLAAKGDPKIPNLQGRTSLHTAAHHGYTDIASFLVDEYRCPVDVQDKEGDTPLHLAAEKGHEETVRYLLARGADPNARGAKERTPLHKGAFGRNPKVMEILLRGGSDIEARDGEGRTPLQLALVVGKGGVVRPLLDKGARFSDDTYAALHNYQLSPMSLRVLQDEWLTNPNVLRWD